MAPLVARQEALSAAAYVRQQAATDMREYAEARDRGMFENLRFLAEEMFPNDRIVVWGHNYHVRHENNAIPPSEAIFPGVTARSMGTWTREHFGKTVFTIGQYEIAGTAVNNAREPYSIPPPVEGSLEHQLRGLADTPYFLDLRRAAGGAQGAWLNAPLPARYNGEHPERLVPARQFDALVVLPRVTPPTFLY
jgi:erythromycin esterase